MAFRSHAKRKFPEIQTGYELNSQGWFSAILALGSRNIIANPSLEKNAIGYTAEGGTITRTTTWQAHGAISLEVTPGAGVNDGVYYGPTEALEANNQYWAQFKFKGDGGRKYKAYIATTAGAQVGTAKQFTATGKTDFIVFPYYETTALARRIYVVKDNETNVRPFYIDGLKLEKNTDWTTYHDGDMTSLIPNFQGYYWEGSPHASASVRVNNEASGGRVVNLRDLGFSILAVLGLGFGGQQPIMSPQGAGGEFYQGTQTTGRDLSLIGEVGTGGLLDLDVSLQALDDLFGADRISPQQPVVLRYEPLDDCGNSLGRTLDIPCVFKGGLEMNRDNPDREKLALTFRLFLPYVANDSTEFGTTLKYSQMLTSTGPILQRDADGVYSVVDTLALSGALDRVNAILRLPDGTYAVGGKFLNAAGIANADYLFHYDPATNTVTAFNATPLTGEVQALELLPDGRIVIGGQFLNAGGDPNADLICVMDPVTFAFSAFNATPITVALFGVRAIKYWPAKNIILVGGDIQNAGGDANADFLFQINPSTGAFSSLNATPLDNTVYTITILANGTEAGIGGAFGDAGGDPNADQIAKVNSSLAYVSINDASNLLNATVRDIFIDTNGDWIIGGDFTTPFSFVMRYNGTGFYALSSGVNNSIFDIGRYDSNLLILGGNLTVAGGLTMPFKMSAWNRSAWVYPEFAYLDTVPGVKTFNYYLGRFLVGLDTAGNRVLTSFVNVVSSAFSGQTKVKFYLKGPGAFYQIKNYANGAAIYLNLTLASGEEAILDLTGPSPSFVSNIRGDISSSIMAGSTPSNMVLQYGNNNISIFSTYTATEINDNNDQLTTYRLTGVTTLNSDAGRLYINVVNTSGSNYRIDIYQDSARTLLVAQSAIYTNAFVDHVTVSQQNSSGISGTILTNATTVTDSDIYIDVPIMSLTAVPALSSLSGAIIPRTF